MILPSSFENKLGFDRIRLLVTENCLCNLGRKQVKAMSFNKSINFIRHELDLTDELRQILLLDEPMPQDNFIDVTDHLKKIKVVGTYPELQELIELKKSIETIRELEKYFSGSETRDKYPVICNEFSNLKYFPLVGKQIDSIINQQGLIKDNASPDLKVIREQMKQKQIQVNRRIHTILRSAQQSGIIETDAEITLRDGRPVIPVPAANKRKLGGLVHDESATGKTVYIEPGEVVELNNELRELQYAERREIIKILTLFADGVRPSIDDLLDAFEILGRIDFIRAKAKVALRLNAVKPILNEDTNFSWRKAIHPLLFLSHASEGKEIIPLDIYLNKDNRILIISGPNAGGKSVCLKTVGLLQYMIQCGMLVPALENSEFCFFDQIFIDIGDEQSLENDLSTYSSHLLNMKQFLRSANSKTLILIDEFGTGTEPVLGGAIAEAMLEEFVKRGSYGVITTHYSNLKQFAADTNGVINGAMLFDTQKIKPLYQLSMGRPGSSFAIDIARNIGLPEEILNSATSKIGEEYINSEKYLREILRDKKYLEEKRQRIRKVERTLDDLYSNYSSELEDLQKDRKKIITEAKVQASQILKEANKLIEKTIREIRETQADKERTRDAREKFEELRNELENADNTDADTFEKKIKELERAGRKLSEHSSEINHSKVNQKLKPELKEKRLEVGDKVVLKGLDTAGEIIEINEKSVMVAFGNMITTLDPAKLEKAKGNQASKKQKPGGNAISGLNERKLSFKSEIDVRGKRADEALEIVRTLIDDAILVGVRSVQILHGKGNGILRQIIRDYLKSLNVVGKISDAHADRGGVGITIAELDF